MKKALKFDDKAPPSEEARRIPNAGEVREFLDRALSMENKINDYRQDLREVYKQAEEQGIDPKALRVVVKHRRKPLEFDFKQEVNEISTKSGGEAIFAAISQ